MRNEKNSIEIQTISPFPFSPIFSQLSYYYYYYYYLKSILLSMTEIIYTLTSGFESIIQKTSSVNNSLERVSLPIHTSQSQLRIVRKLQRPYRVRARRHKVLQPNSGRIVICRSITGVVSSVSRLTA